MGGVYTRIQNVASLRPGDHICIWDSSRWPITYQHHGIVWSSGLTPQEIKVWHVWSPLQGDREAQADSHVCISTLEEFIYGRNSSNLRLVEYHTSGLREVMSRWGEVHLSKADLPEVVLTRCNFLLGLGKGKFHIIWQNCEHAAYWCMTGRQWCKQNLTLGKERVPFEHSISKRDVTALYQSIEEIKEASRAVVENVLKLSQRLVYLRTDGNQYVKLLDSGQLGLASEEEGTAFRLSCYCKGYNSIKVSFYHVESDRYMFSRSTLSCFRDLRMKKANLFRGSTGAKWEYSSSGILVSMNQHRRYIGVRKDQLLFDVSMRGDASRFEFILSSPLLQESRTPPDIHLVSKEYDRQKHMDVGRQNSNDAVHGFV